MSEQTEGIAATGDRWLEALEWHTRFDAEGDLTPQQIQHWQRWMSDDENRRVFDEYSRFAGNAERYRKRPRPGVEDLLRDRYDPSQPIPYEAAPSSQPGARLRSSGSGTVPGAAPSMRRKWFRPLVAAGTATTVFLGILAVWRIFAPSAFHPSAPPLVQETRSGEVRDVALPDGSHVTLGALSAISVQFSAERRSVDLRRGEALFQVNHDPQRPFVVAAGTRAITAIGTAFVVRRDSDRVEVAVTEGAVSVMQQAPGSAPLLSFLPREPATYSQEARITGGQRVTYDDAGHSTPIEPADAVAVTGWSKGRLEFDHQPMRYVIETVNRYSSRTIQLDLDTARQVYTGLILQDQIEDWVRALPRAFPIQLVEHEHAICLRSLHPTAPDTPSAPCEDSP